MSERELWDIYANKKAKDALKELKSELNSFSLESIALHDMLSMEAAL